MSLLEESLRVQQQRLTTQDEQIKMQQKQLEQYELNLQMVADQVRAQGTLLQAQANLFKLDREDREKKEKRERAKARPPASRGEGRRVQPSGTQQTPDGSCGKWQEESGGAYNVYKRSV